MRSLLSPSLAALALLATVSSIAVAAPLTFSHQGRLFDVAGDPLTGSHTIAFTLHDAPSGGTTLWSEPHAVQFDNGYYAVVLGSSAPLDPADFASDDVYLSLAVDGAPQLSRTQLQSVPWALRADTATNVDGGVVNASEIRVNGNTVIDSSGTPNVDWTDLSGVPAGFADGTDDGWAPPTCTNNQELVFNGSAWACQTVNAHQHDAADLGSGTIAMARLNVGNTPGTLATGDHQHNGVEGLTCDAGQIPEFDGGAWTCVADNAHSHNEYATNTALATLSGQVSSNGSDINALQGDVSTINATDSAQAVDIAALRAATVTFTPLNAPTSMRADCKAILGASESKGSGLYYIHPNNSTYLAYCDMDTEDGGWTLVMNIHPNDGSIASFANTKFWMAETEYGGIGGHFTNDYKSPAAWEVVGTAVMVEVAQPGMNGGIIGYKAWNMPVRSYDSFFDLASNTTLTSSVIGSNLTNVYAYEPIIKNGTNLVANRNINANQDRVRLGAAGYTAQGDDNQPGLGTQMNEASCGVGVNCYRYRDVELWVNSNGNLWCSRPGPGSYGWIGNDGGCGDQCGSCDTIKSGAYYELWTYRMFIR